MSHLARAQFMEDLRILLSESDARINIATLSIDSWIWKDAPILLEELTQEAFDEHGEDPSFDLHS